MLLFTWKQDACVSTAERREGGDTGRVELRGQAVGSEWEIRVQDNMEISDWEITSEKHTGGSQWEILLRLGPCT